LETEEKRIASGIPGDIGVKVPTLEGKNGPMCGRFVQAQPPDWYARFLGVDSVRTEALEPSWNVAPTDQVYAVATHQGIRQLGTFNWGLLPFWAKDRKLSAKNINARMETAATKPAFRDSFATRRCLIPADGFYEWERREEGKLPHYFHAADGRTLALAGLWASWRDPTTGERLRTCTIVTGRPDDLVARLHDRMPVILAEAAWEEWLDPDLADVDRVTALLRSAAAVTLAEHPVSTLVNRVDNNLPECIAPIAAPPS
jgi:putative SOS response-associated peptidase YedK